jgi:hypothetical protein
MRSAPAHIGSCILYGLPGASCAVVPCTHLNLESNWRWTISPSGSDQIRKLYARPGQRTHTPRPNGLALRPMVGSLPALT